jgi:hypothetical protein
MPKNANRVLRSRQWFHLIFLLLRLFALIWLSESLLATCGFCLLFHIGVIYGGACYVHSPVSLTSVTSKILEHNICRHLFKHLEKNKILTNLNHGFRSGYSCETQLLTTINDFLQNTTKDNN